MLCAVGKIPLLKFAVLSLILSVSNFNLLLSVDSIILNGSPEYNICGAVAV